MFFSINFPCLLVFQKKTVQVWHHWLNNFPHWLNNFPVLFKEGDEEEEVRTDSLGTLSYMPPEVLCPDVVGVVVDVVAVVVG